MENHADRAARLFREGCSCSQSVLVAFCDRTGLDEKTALKLSSSFGGGLGRLREVCGAVSGAAMALGLILGPDDPSDRGAKAAHYARVQSLAAQFAERHGSIVCRDLLGDKAGSGHVPDARTAAYYAMRPCERCVYDAAEILEAMLDE